MSVLCWRKEDTVPQFMFGWKQGKFAKKIMHLSFLWTDWWMLTQKNWASLFSGLLFPSFLLTSPWSVQFGVVGSGPFRMWWFKRSKWNTTLLGTICFSFSHELWLFFICSIKHDNMSSFFLNNSCMHLLSCNSNLKKLGQLSLSP